jgi:hypothetical protein
MQPQQDQNYWQPSDDAPLDNTQETVATYAPEGEDSAQPEKLAPISWQASEFIHHEKNTMWFVALVAVATALLLLDIFLIKSWTFGALIVVMAVSAAVVARRPPRVIDYSLSLQGVRIDDKLFSFHDFRAFGVVQEGAFYSIRLVPNKRFMPMVSVYFPSEQGEQIVDMIGSMLPMENIERDAIDKLVEKIRF